MNLKLKIRNETQTSFRLSLGRAEIITLVEANGILIPPNEELIYPTIPSSAEVIFRVPTGGDWSGMNCDIDDDFPVVISWEGKNPDA